MIFLNIAKTDFNCPYCNKEYNDSDDKYLNRCNRNKYWLTNIKCSCGEIFFMTYSYMGEAVAFKK